MNNQAWKWVIVACIVILCFAIIFAITPSGRAVWNKWTSTVQEVDDKTNYTTRKKVEDTCRSMIASYISDRLVWEQYKDSTDKDERLWSEQAKIRANKTAATYNNYILKNRFVFSENVPNDIFEQLDYLR